MAGGDHQDPSTGAAAFATTHWSVVLAAGGEPSAPAAEALETLCRSYWQPLYVYARRRGYGLEDAQDLTQQFLARFVRNHSFRLADPARGRFRTFLLKSLQNFLADDWRRAHRLKRGGDMTVISLDGPAAETNCALELAETMTPERAFERRWAMTLLAQVLERMGEDYRRAGKGRLFDALKEHLWGTDGAPTYAQVGQDLDLSEGALRVAVHRLREHYRERLRAEVAQTVSHPAEVDEELRHLIAVVSGAA